MTSTPAHPPLLRGLGVTTAVLSALFQDMKARTEEDVPLGSLVEELRSRIGEPSRRIVVG